MSALQGSTPPEKPKKSKVASSPLGEDRLPPPLIRSLVEIYYDFQGQRIITGNRIMAQVKSKAITEEQLEKYGINALFKKAEAFENDIKVMLTAQVPLHPIHNEHLKRIYGIGPVLSAGLMAYIGEIGKFDNISRLWSFCYDEKTEVLTRGGFRLFRDLRHDDEIMTLNPESDSMEFQKHLGLFQIPYEGKMVQFQGRSHDYLVTPEHPMYVRRHSGKFKFASAISVYKHLNKYPCAHVELKRDGIWEGKEIESFSLPIVESRQFHHPKSGLLVTHCGVRNPQKISAETWLKFIGWYLTEGSCNVHGKRKGARVSIGQSLINPEYRFEIKQVLQDIGFSPYLGKTSLDISSRSLYEYLIPLGKSYTKFIPSELKNLVPGQLKILIETMMKGDGSSDMRLSTVSKKMSDDFQEIVVKAGYSTSVSFSKRGIYRITIVKREHTPLITKTPSLVDYNGFVYNLTVPKYHIIMVRRNGKTGWSSSSGFGMSAFGK